MGALRRVRGVKKPINTRHQVNLEKIPSLRYGMTMALFALRLAPCTLR